MGRGTVQGAIEIHRLRDSRLTTPSTGDHGLPIRNDGEEKCVYKRVWGKMSQSLIRSGPNIEE